MFGATTLIIAISARAPLLPTESIMCAACSVNSRAYHARLRDPLADDAVVRDIAAEGMAAERTLAQGLKGTLGNADEPHAPNGSTARASFQ